MVRNFFLDLHVHSRYSRACSKNLLLPKIDETAARRGLDILATGDFTHPGWFVHLKENLVEVGSGIYEVKGSQTHTKFLIGTEISSIKKHAGKTRRVHHLILAPNLSAAEKFNLALEEKNINLKADGRPIIGLTSKEILVIAKEVDEKMEMIPAHAWTPWFGVFGSFGGYDSLEECFEEYADKIFAIETGLSSDPPMSRSVPFLQNITLVSNSDAHSLEKLGREANVLKLEEKNLSYDLIISALKNPKGKFFETIEFFPEEGKYHADGHAACQFFCEPDESLRLGGICPKCRLPLTIGVKSRTVELSDEDFVSKNDGASYRSVVPLAEVVGSAVGFGVKAKAVTKILDKLYRELGNDFFVLLEADINDVERVAGARVARCLQKARNKEIFIRPGYDGVFGVVKIELDDIDNEKTQSNLKI